MADRLPFSKLIVSDASDSSIQSAIVDRITHIESLRLSAGKVYSELVLIELLSESIVVSKVWRHVVNNYVLGADEKPGKHKSKSHLASKRIDFIKEYSDVFKPAFYGEPGFMDMDLAKLRQLSRAAAAGDADSEHQVELFYCYYSTVIGMCYSYNKLLLEGIGAEEARDRVAVVPQSVPTQFASITTYTQYFTSALTQPERQGRGRFFNIFMTTYDTTPRPSRVPPRRARPASPPPREPSPRPLTKQQPQAEQEGLGDPEIEEAPSVVALPPSPSPPPSPAGGAVVETEDTDDPEAEEGPVGAHPVLQARREGAQSWALVGAALVFLVLVLGFWWSARDQRPATPHPSDTGALVESAPGLGEVLETRNDNGELTLTFTGAEGDTYTMRPLSPATRSLNDRVVAVEGRGVVVLEATDGMWTTTYIWDYERDTLHFVGVEESTGLVNVSQLPGSDRLIRAVLGQVPEQTYPLPDVTGVGESDPGATAEASSRDGTRTWRHDGIEASPRIIEGEGGCYPQWRTTQPVPVYPEPRTSVPPTYTLPTGTRIGVGDRSESLRVLRSWGRVRTKQDLQIYVLKHIGYGRYEREIIDIQQGQVLETKWLGSWAEGNVFTMRGQEYVGPVPTGRWGWENTPSYRDDFEMLEFAETEEWVQLKSRAARPPSWLMVSQAMTLQPGIEYTEQYCI